MKKTISFHVDNITPQSSTTLCVMASSSAKQVSTINLYQLETKYLLQESVYRPVGALREDKLFLVPRVCPLVS